MSYLSDLEKILTPEQYKALTKPMQFQAKQSYKGQPQDWQAQILTPLDVSKLNTPKQISVIPGQTKKEVVSAGEDSYYTRDVSSQPSLSKELSKQYNPITVDVGGGGEEAPTQKVTGFKSKNPIDVNGVPVYALYDANGNLTGYEGSSKKRMYVNDSTSYKGVWDANGKAAPKKIVSEGGGFFKGIVKDVMSDPVLGSIANAVAYSYGGPAGVAALNAGSTAVQGGNLGDVLESGAKAGLLSYGAQQVAQNFGGGADVGGADTGSADMGAGGGAGVDLGTATGADLSAAYDMGNVGDLGAGGGLLTDAATTAITGNADKAALYGDAGYGAGMTGAETTAFDTGLASGAAAAGAGAAGSGLLTGNAVTDAALIKGATSLAGGLLQGETTKDALTSDATARANLAKEVKDMGKFTPVGITTTFGTSNFVTDPVTGAITPSYTLSPTAKAWQDSLSTLGTGALSSASDIMNLGKQYISESPEAASKNYIDLQKALLAPGREQTLAGIRTNLANTGRGGLSFGATSDGLAATNPELAAYYNSLAMADRKIAAEADTAARDRITFGTGLMSGATKPFTNVFEASKSVETAAQQPLTLSTDFANTAATRGAAQGSNYANAMNPSLNSTYKANTYDPFATFLQGLSDSDLAAWGLSKIKP